MIGKGSFARVYLVEDKDTKARFAVKAFSKEHHFGIETAIWYQRCKTLD